MNGKLRGIENEDTEHIPGQVCIVGILAIFISLADLGFGKHFWAIPFNNVISAVRLLWISTLLYAAGISFVKLSVALFLLRIIQRPVYRRLLSGTIGKPSHSSYWMRMQF